MKLTITKEKGAVSLSVTVEGLQEMQHFSDVLMTERKDGYCERTAIAMALGCAINIIRRGEGEKNE